MTDAAVRELKTSGAGDNWNRSGRVTKALMRVDVRPGQVQLQAEMKIITVFTMQD